MRPPNSSQLRLLALGVGFLTLAVGISALLGPFQRNQGPEDMLSLLTWISSAYSDSSKSDSVSKEVEKPEVRERYGGPGDVASVQDTAELVVRDAKGNVKHRQTIK